MSKTSTKAKLRVEHDRADRAIAALLEFKAALITLQEIKDGLAALRTEVVRLGGRLTLLETEVVRLGGRLTLLETEVVRLGGRLTLLETEIANPEVPAE